MEPGSSLPHSKEPTTCSNSEPHQLSPCPPPAFGKIHFIILESTPRFSKWYLTVRPLIQNTFMYFSFLPYMLHALPYVILLHLSTRIIFGWEYSSWNSSMCSFLHSPVISSLLGPNFVLKHPILKQPQPMFLLYCERPSFTPIQHTRQYYSYVYLNL